MTSLSSYLLRDKEMRSIDRNVGGKGEVFDER